MLEKKSHLKYGAMTLGITAISLMTLSLTTLQITQLIMKKRDNRHHGHSA